MTYVALLALIALTLVALTYAQTIRWLIREHARERSMLLNQMMHLAGRTWQPPPQVEASDQAYDFTDEVELLDPAQLPVDYS